MINLKTEYRTLTVPLPFARLIFVEEEEELPHKAVHVLNWDPGLKTPYGVVIHAATQLTRRDFITAQRLGVVIDESDRGRIMGMVEVFRSERLTMASWEALKPLSLEVGDLPGRYLFGLSLRRPLRLEELVTLNQRHSPRFFGYPKINLLHCKAHPTRSYPTELLRD